MTLSGKTVVIVGGDVSLVRALAMGVAEAGADTCLANTTNPASLDGIALAIRSRGHRVLALEAARPASSREVEENVAAIYAEFGNIDVLINVIDGFLPANLLDLSRDHLDKLVSMRTDDAFWWCQTVARRMVRLGKHGSIVNLVSTVAPSDPDVSPLHHLTGSVGAIVLTKSIAAELLESRIYVNAIVRQVQVSGVERSDWSGEGRVMGLRTGVHDKFERVVRATISLALADRASMAGEVVYIDDDTFS